MLTEIIQTLFIVNIFAAGIAGVTLPIAVLFGSIVSAFAAAMKKTPLSQNVFLVKTFFYALFMILLGGETPIFLWLNFFLQPLMSAAAFHHASKNNNTANKFNAKLLFVIEIIMLVSFIEIFIIMSPKD